jgi:hypothetical protein
MSALRNFVRCIAGTVPEIVAISALSPIEIADAALVASATYDDGARVELRLTLARGRARSGLRQPVHLGKPAIDDGQRRALGIELHASRCVQFPHEIAVREANCLEPFTRGDDDVVSPHPE